ATACRQPAAVGDDLDPARRRAGGAVPGRTRRRGGVDEQLQAVAFEPVVAAITQALGDRTLRIVMGKGGGDALRPSVGAALDRGEAAARQGEGPAGAGEP